VACAHSFDAFVAEHQVALVRYAALLSGSPAQGEDIVQDVLIRLYPRWADISDPLPYVRRSVTNEFLSWRRRWSTRFIHIVPDAVLDRPVEDTRSHPEVDPELWGRLQRLPRQQRAAVVLRYWEGLDNEEIGRVLQCKAATVRGHVSRAIATLRAGMTASTGMGHDD
jgi:RNA polymerase sigma-70 factor (sigma-E family)